MKNEEVLPGRIDVKEILNRFLEYKWYYIAIITLFLAGAYLKNKYAPVIYENTATILINTDNKNGFMNKDDLFSNFGLFGADKNIENEIGILKSFTLIKNTISSLNFEVGYFFEENIINVAPLQDFDFNIINTSLYKEAPVKVNLDRSHNQPIDVLFYVDILSDTTFRIQARGTDVSLYNYIDNNVVRKIRNFSIDKVYKFGETIVDKNYSFTVTKNPEGYSDIPVGKLFYFQLYHLDYLTLQYRNNLTINKANENASLINISINGYNQRKITEFINVFIDKYLETNLVKKNKVALSTVSFIDNQISEVADSLSAAEYTLESFRSRNKVMDLGYQGQKLYERLGEFEREKANLNTQQRYYQWVIDYFDNNKEGYADIVPPSSMNVVDPLLTKLIEEFVTLNSERKNLVNNRQTKSLHLSSLENKISNLRQTILENVRNNLNTVNMSINEINYQENQLSGQISNLPKTELKLLGIERNFELNNTIYTYLLQKRAEAQIAAVSNTPDYDVVDEARLIMSGPVAPKRKLNYIIALFLGLALPSGVILLRDYLNNTLVSEQDIEHYTHHPVIGTIYRNNKGVPNVVAAYNKSAITESFRAVRTNLQIMFKGKMNRTVIVTSSTGGEGKTFTALNLASAFASFGSRAVLVGFDLRKPTMHEKIGANNIVGLSNYLSERAGFNDIVQKTNIENLDFIPAGPIPPNPSELIASERAILLFTELKRRYSYIVVDSAPLGAVSDSYLLMNHGDATIFVVRQNYTHKDIFKDTMKQLRHNKLDENVYFVLNDVTKRGAKAYGYNAKYYDEEEVNTKTKITSFLKKDVKKKHSA
ncbi:MAG: GumC family protein [Bacteroidota bacterium]